MGVFLINPEGLEYHDYLISLTIMTLGEFPPFVAHGKHLRSTCAIFSRSFQRRNLILYLSSKMKKSLGVP